LRKEAREFILATITGMTQQNRRGAELAQPHGSRAHSWLVLSDRGLIRVAGRAARDFLQGLVSNDVRTLAPGRARYAALLTPQGKIFGDFLIVALADDALLIDCPKDLTGELVNRLSFYKLRAKLDIVDRSNEEAIVASWGNGAADSMPVAYRDPRDPALGWRAIISRGTGPAGFDQPMAAPHEYDGHRIGLRIPHGGADFAYLETFPHEANLDLLQGIDFNKGCYVGQEVVSRVHHRGSWRKRIARVFFAGPAPPSGASLTAGDTVIGVMGSATVGQGLASIRVDRANAALERGQTVQVGDLAVTVELNF
jgi:folate-binding protein YgfZ